LQPADARVAFVKRPTRGRVRVRALLPPEGSSEPPKKTASWKIIPKKNESPEFVTGNSTSQNDLSFIKICLSFRELPTLFSIANTTSDTTTNNNNNNNSFFFISCSCVDEIPNDFEFSRFETFYQQMKEQVKFFRHADYTPLNTEFFTELFLKTNVLEIEMKSLNVFSFFIGEQLSQYDTLIYVNTDRSDIVQFYERFKSDTSKKLRCFHMIFQEGKGVGPASKIADDTGQGGVLVNSGISGEDVTDDSQDEGWLSWLGTVLTTYIPSGQMTSDIHGVEPQKKKENE